MPTGRRAETHPAGDRDEERLAQAKAALDRVEISQDVRNRLSDVLAPGSSWIISDEPLRGSHRAVGYDPNPDARKRLEDEGAESAASLANLVAKVPVPHIVWLMPAGEITEATLTALLYRVVRTWELAF